MNLKLALLEEIGNILLYSLALVPIVLIIFPVIDALNRAFANGGLKMLTVRGKAGLMMQLKAKKSAQLHVMNVIIVLPVWMKRDDVCGVKQHSNVLVFQFIQVNISLVYVGNG
uniref:Putative product n=1 Tax=Xenopsylla cheopis TaxID=163159 RepID=A0A6M2E1G9_XENCH